ncbi:unnamed protein product [Debaryomyces tyrocola]|nr:unnamed protein product [Debaryomyces tyrocola]
MWQFVLLFMFNPDQANMGSKINFIFAACCFISIFCFYFYLPETANRSFDEIDEMYIKKVPARKFRNFISDTQIKASDKMMRKTDSKLNTLKLDIVLRI